MLFSVAEPLFRAGGEHWSANELTSTKKGGPTPGSNTQPTATGSDERRNVQFALKIIF